ncbi:MAG: hypothetical protein ACOCTT_03920 [archaeon]
MRIAAQFPHFWEDKQGKSHRNMLQLEVEEPKMKGNYPKDGSIMIRLQGEDEQKAFKLTPKEALTVGEELREISKEVMKKKRDLWKKKNKD